MKVLGFGCVDIFRPPNSNFDPGFRHFRPETSPFYETKKVSHPRFVNYKFINSSLILR